MPRRHIRSLVLLLAWLGSSGWAQSIATQEKFLPIDIFLTSYKGPPVSDVSQYHDSELGKNFVLELLSDDDERFCLQGATIEKTVGIWEGNTEPSYWMHVLGRLYDADSFAVEHGKEHLQDAVLLFAIKESGDDAEYVISLPSTATKDSVLSLLKKASFKGATLMKGRLIVTDTAAARRRDAEELARSLRGSIRIHRGEIHLITSDRYNHIMDAYSKAERSCPVGPSGYNFGPRGEQ